MCDVGTVLFAKLSSQEFSRIQPNIDANSNSNDTYLGRSSPGGIELEGQIITTQPQSSHGRDTSTHGQSKTIGCAPSKKLIKATAWGCGIFGVTTLGTVAGMLTGNPWLGVVVCLSNTAVFGGAVEGVQQCSKRNMGGSGYLNDIA